MIGVTNIGFTEVLLSQAEIALLLGVSRTRVKQIEERALEKIRAAVLADGELRQLAIEAGCVLQPTKARARWSSPTNFP